LNATPASNRLHIVFLGRTNTGKSSLLNALTNQDLAVVSAISGTTTDPVKKSMELLPLGPVVLIDTPGLDDTGELGSKRIEKTKEALRQADMAIVVADAQTGLAEAEKAVIEELKKKSLPYLVAYNKADLLTEEQKQKYSKEHLVSSLTREGVNALKEALGKLKPQKDAIPLIQDLVSPGDIIFLVVPIDSAAPKGRLILPQQQVIRDALEKGALPLVTRDTELAQALTKITPTLVVTDSQAFGKVSKIVPESIPLTSFSILLSRAKGDLEEQIKGIKALLSLKDHDPVLIAEGCTHHRQCEDIGTVKIPKWIREKLQVEPDFHFTSGGEYPKDLTPYKVVIHCGGCMLPPQEMKNRLLQAKEQGVPITNYGMAIAALHNVLARSLQVFPSVANLLSKEN
ncbi:[FeFe] hydrogenase H-cluster maturation GTPase HydF, partial [bacterium]|nr:[FeFe] hydrogenase H-cluster maturation GTPase HydF [bacterium]